MIFQETAIEGAFLVDLEPNFDNRGFFARTFCEDEFEKRGLNTCWPQSNLSHSDRRGTLRGMHFQLAPASEVKLVRICRGTIFVAVADLRASLYFGKITHGVISAEERRLLYIPVGCAFGFQTLSDDAELDYRMSAKYQPELAAGVRWDDPDLAIPWPLEVTSISERDKFLPLLSESAVAPA